MPHTEHSDVDKKTLRKVIAAAAIGNFVEWFDFAIYGFLATILTKLFFPSENLTIGLLKTFAVFAVAFALRPIGGIVFGILGDRVGRKNALSFTIILMAVATTLIGLLPTHETAGLWAPVLLLFLRCTQAFSAGGEYAGACAYVMEHTHPRRRSFIASFIPLTTYSTFAFAAVVVYILETLLTTDAMMSWGWRIPFLIAAPAGLIGLYVRLKLNETPAFRELEREQEVAHTPLAETIRLQMTQIAKLGAFISLTALAFYTFATYFVTYLQTVGDMARSTSQLIAFISLFFAAMFCPIVGLYSDLVGRQKTIVSIFIFLLIVVYPAFALGGSGYIVLALIGAALLAAASAFPNVLTVRLLSEAFPTRSRYTASALTYNLAYTIFGGTAPFMATWLISASGYHMMPAVYLILISILALAGGLFLKKDYQVSFHEQENSSNNTPISNFNHEV